MAAKVKFDRGSWWVFTHYRGKRKKKRVGPTKANKREAEQIAKMINAALALGTFSPHGDEDKPVPCDLELRRWCDTYGATLKRSSEIAARGLIENHLAPAFGSSDLRELSEADLLQFIRSKLDEGLSPKTIKNALSILRRVCSLAVRDRRMERNPAAGIGDLMRRVDRRLSTEVKKVEVGLDRKYWRFWISLGHTNRPFTLPCSSFFPQESGEASCSDCSGETSTLIDGRS